MSNTNMADLPAPYKMWDALTADSQNDPQNDAGFAPWKPLAELSGHDWGMQDTSSAGARKGRENNRPWFKFYTRDFRDGVRVLSLEEVGAYTLVLSLLYETGGKLKDDPKVICAQLGCDVRVWRRVRERLLQEGKFVATDDGFLTNDRASKEIASAEHLSEVRRTSGRSGGQQSGKSRAKPMGDNETPEANASVLLAPEGRRQSPDTSKEESLGVGGEEGEGFKLTPDAPPKSVRKAREKSEGYRATAETMPVDPPPEWVGAATEAGMLNGTVAFEWGECRKHHIREKTIIKDLAARCDRWCANWVRGGARQVHAKLAGPVQVDAQGRRFKNVRHNPI